MRALPDGLRLPIVEAYNEALLPIFLFMVPLAALAILALVFIEETPLATTIEWDDVDAPSATDDTEGAARRS